MQIQLNSLFFVCLFLRGTEGRKETGREEGKKQRGEGREGVGRKGRKTENGSRFLELNY